MKKIISILLLLSMLTLAACASDSGNSGQAETTAAADTTAAVTEAPEETRAPLNVPTVDYDGYKFRVLETDTANGTAYQFASFYWTSESSGDLINDAVQERNMIVEERLNVSIEAAFSKNVNNDAKTHVLAGDDNYDIYMGFVNGAFPLAQEGLLVDLYDVPHIDLTAEWWDAAALRDLAIAGKMYVGMGDATISDEELNYCIFANKTVWKEYEVGDLYQLTKDGGWTLDAMSEASRSVTHDLDGDGIINEKDVYGVLTSPGLCAVWFISAGGRICELHDDGRPEIVLGDTKNIERIDALQKFIADSSIVLNVDTIPGTWTTANNMLMEDRLLFRVGSVYNIQQYRDMVNDFGILPYPKYDEAQDSYHHLIATQICGAVLIPVTVSDLDRTGAILESIAYESNETVTKAYYDVNLYTKVSRDNESGEMFDIIFATKCFDIGKVFAWGNLEGLINSGGTGGFAAKFASAETAANTALEKSYELFID